MFAILPRRPFLYLFITIIILSPLPFGSNRPLSWSILALTIGILVFIDFFVQDGDAKSDKIFLRRMAPGITLFTAATLYMWFQTSQWLPPNWAHPMWLEVHNLFLILPVEATITLDPDATFTAITRFLLYGGVFWLAAKYSRDSETAYLILKASIIAITIYSLYGLIVYFGEFNTILWFDKWAYQLSLTSTFVNRNTFATFAGLGLLGSVALLFDHFSVHGHYNLSIRRQIRDFIDTIISKAWLPAVGTLLIATALLLTQSRAGVLSSCMALIVLLLCLIHARMMPKVLGYFAFSAVILGAIVALMTSGEGFLHRLNTKSFETSQRGEVYERVANAWMANPILGNGYGTFETAFKAYKTPELSGFNWDMAHNTYLELLLEIGTPSTAIVISLFIWLFGVCVYGLVKRRRRKVFAALGVAAIVLVSLHAVVDFSLQIPGFTVFFALIMGMAWSQSWPSSRKTG